MEPTRSSRTSWTICKVSHTLVSLFGLGFWSLVFIQACCWEICIEFLANYEKFREKAQKGEERNVGVQLPTAVGRPFSDK